ncbi:Transcription factor vrtR2 [Talaromyces pinophilus]|nr:Transcription factor vrtR2 [Talaromyces pinophilus]
MTSSSKSTTHRPVVSQSLLPTLSCHFCRHRKIKCDKLDPCTACQRAGVNCESVRRKRLPRGRHIPKSVATRGSNTTRDALKEKIDRLEALVNGVLGEGGDGKGETSVTTTATTTTTTGKGVSDGSSQGFEPGPRALASQFWASVINEIRESRGFAGDDTAGDDDDDYDDEDDDEEEQAEEGERTHPAQESARGYMPFMGLSLGRLGHTLPHSLSIRPSPAVTTALCDIYLNQVDRIIKVLHRPSLKRHLLEGIPYPAVKRSREAENALDTAVFYAAVASMTDRQCYNLFQCSRNEVLPEYQSACEMALERADLMRTTDMMVLQAFVLYLVATRAHDKSRAVWTLLATAVRVAQALNLHVESLSPTETFFNQQMRKRLWFTICLLDVQTCFDPDSRPLIPLEMTQPTLPLNVNDSDFDPSSVGDLPERDEVTDVTFALFTYNLQICGRRLYYIPRGEHLARENILKSFKDSVLPLVRHCNPDDSDYSWLVYYASQNLISSTQLHVFRRPDHDHQQQQQQQQQQPSLLELCLENLENIPRIHGDDRGEGFRWYIQPQWPQILLAIKECFVTTDAALLKRAWPLIEDVVGHYEKTHRGPNTRSRKLMLRKSLEKARRRVDSIIQSAADDDHNNIAYVNGVEDLPDMDLGWDELFNDFSFGEFSYGDCIDWTGSNNF